MMASHLIKLNLNNLINRRLKRVGEDRGHGSHSIEESHIWDCEKQVYLGGFDTANSATRYIFLIIIANVITELMIKLQ